MLAGQLHQSIHILQSERLASVQLTKIDGLGNIRVRFGPVLTHLIHQPGHQFKFALAQQFGRAKKQLNPLLERHPAPAFECRERRLHGGLYVFFACLLMNSDDLRRSSGIYRPNLVSRADSVSANYEIVFTSKLPTNAV